MSDARARRTYAVLPPRRMAVYRCSHSRFFAYVSPISAPPAPFDAELSPMPLLSCAQPPRLRRYGQIFH
jgi:hypothetical protein